MRDLAAVALACFLATSGPALAEPESDASAVRAAVQDLVSSWREGDRAKGDAVLHPEFRLTTRRDEADSATPGAGPYVEVSDRKAMMKIYDIPGSKGWDDRLEDITVQVMPSGTAVLSARYMFYMAGKLSHCGDVSIQLYKLSSGWKLISFADTHHWARPGDPGGCLPPPA